MITCYLRYKIDMYKRKEFMEYATAVSTMATSYRKRAPEILRSPCLLLAPLPRMRNIENKPVKIPSARKPRRTRKRRDVSWAMNVSS
jgi:hypothetical protein